MEPRILQENEVAITQETFQHLKKVASEDVERTAQIKRLQEENVTLKAENANLWAIIRAFKVYFELITYCVLRFTSAFGLNNKEDNMIRPEIMSGEEKPTSSVLKQVIGLGTEAALAEYNPAKRKAMEDRYSFFQYLIPVSDFYQRQKHIKVEIPEETMKDLPVQVQKELLNPTIVDGKNIAV